MKGRVELYAVMNLRPRFKGDVKRALESVDLGTTESVAS